MALKAASGESPSWLASHQPYDKRPGAGAGACIQHDWAFQATATEQPQGASREGAISVLRRAPSPGWLKTEGRPETATGAGALAKRILPQAQEAPARPKRKTFSGAGVSGWRG